MSIFHTFLMTTNRTTNEIVDVLAENLPFVEYVTTEEDLIPRANKWKSITTTNKVMNFTVLDGGTGQKRYEKVLGFRPDVTLIFDMRKDDERYKAGKAQVLYTSVWMLQYFPGDAVLEIDEVIAMHRKDGNIFLSSKAREIGYLTDVDLANFTLPYEWAELLESVYME